MPTFNLMSKNGAYPADGQRESPRRIFSKLIIITALIPIFSFQKVEGKMFSPSGIHLGIRFVGSFVVHVDLGAGHVIHVAETERAREEQLLCAFHQREIGGLFDKCHAHRKISVGIAGIVAVGGLWMFTLLGTEFLPQLNEGSIYIRATLPQSISVERVGTTGQ